MFKKFDGSGRTPRKIQADILEKLAERWDKYDTFGIQAPCGVGKQAIARALQLEHGGIYITPSNALIDQAVTTYPQANFLKGREHYICKDGLSCQDAYEFKKVYCKHCPYAESRRQAVEGIPTMTNPVAYYYLKMGSDVKRPKLLVVDEADRLPSFMTQMAKLYVPVKRFGAPDPDKLVEWLDRCRQQLHRLRKQQLERGKKDEATETGRQARAFDQAWYLATHDPGNYDVRVENGRVLCEPLLPPKSILRRLLDADKVVFLSATLLPAHGALLGISGRAWFYRAPSPIPKENRQVVFSPISSRVNKDTPLEYIAAWIKGQMEQRPGLSTIVHVTYEKAKQLAPLFPEALTNTPDTKTKVLARFKKQGGLWLASGCAEGIDLPGDSCRLNLIPILLRDNLGDPVVRRRLELAGGRERYDIETLCKTIQQSGRSTRGIDDWSTVVIGDPAFKWLAKKYENQLPPSFVEAIEWGKK